MTAPRRGAVAVALLALAAASAPAARAQGPEAGIPDVPAGDATIRGEVRHSTRPEGAAGVEVVLYALSAAGAPGLRRGVSDAEGAFEFAGISPDPSVAYLVGARFQDVPYPGARVRFGAGQRLREVTVRIADVQRDPAAVRLEELGLRLDFLGGNLQVSETLKLRNDGDRTVWVPPDAREGARPAVETRLPEGAAEFRSPLGVTPEGLVREGETLRWFGPVYPGDQELSYAYALPAGEGAVRLGRATATRPERLVVLAPADGPAPSGPGLEQAGEEELEGRTYRRFEGTVPARGRRLDIAFEVPPASRDASRVSVAEARVILDPDAAALQAREEHVIRVSGDERVVAPPEAPLLRIPLPEGAQAVRFGGDTGLGLVPHPSGDLALLGPLPPGESVVGLSYLLSDGAPTRVLERRFEHPLPLLTIYVWDAGGLRLESDRLHRRRPVRTPDRTYARLEAFEIAAGEAVALSIGTLPPRTGLPRGGLLLAFAAVSVAVIGAIVAPLRRRDEAGAERATPESASRREREALYAALRDLEHDHETQKVYDEDYAVLRDDLRTRSVALLRAEIEQAG